MGVPASGDEEARVGEPRVDPGARAGKLLEAFIISGRANPELPAQGEIRIEPGIFLPRVELGDGDSLLFFLEDVSIRMLHDPAQLGCGPGFSRLLDVLFQ